MVPMERGFTRVCSVNGDYDLDRAGVAIVSQAIKDNDDEKDQSIVGNSCLLLSHESCNH